MDCNSLRDGLEIDGDRDGWNRRSAARDGIALTQMTPGARVPYLWVSATLEED